jgi:hypothetical protein
MASPGLEFVSSGQKGFLLFFTASLSVPPVLVIAALDFFSIRTPPRSVVLSLAPSRRSRSDRVFRFKILFYGSSRPKRVHFPAAGFGLRVKCSATGRSCSHSGSLLSALIFTAWYFFELRQRFGPPDFVPRPVRPLFGSLHDPVPATDFFPNTVFSSARRVPRATRSRSSVRACFLAGLSAGRSVFRVNSSSVSHVLASEHLQMPVLLLSHQF